MAASNRERPAKCKYGELCNSSICQLHSDPAASRPLRIVHSWLTVCHETSWLLRRCAFMQRGVRLLARVSVRACVHCSGETCVNRCHKAPLAVNNAPLCSAKLNYHRRNYVCWGGSVSVRSEHKEMLKQ